MRACFGSRNSPPTSIKGKSSSFASRVLDFDNSLIVGASIFHHIKPVMFTLFLRFLELRPGHSSRPIIQSFGQGFDFTIGHRIAIWICFVQVESGIIGWSALPTRFAFQDKLNGFFFEGQAFRVLLAVRVEFFAIGPYPNIGYEFVLPVTGLSVLNRSIIRAVSFSGLNRTATWVCYRLTGWSRSKVSIIRCWLSRFFVKRICVGFAVVIRMDVFLRFQLTVYQFL